MYRSRMLSVLLAGGLILSSAGIAFAADGNDFAGPSSAGVANTVVAQNVSQTTSKAKSATPADNPFAMYHDFGAPANVGTPVTQTHIATSKNMLHGSLPGSFHDGDQVRG